MEQRYKVQLEFQATQLGCVPGTTIVKAKESKDLVDSIEFDVGGTIISVEKDLLKKIVTILCD